MAETTTPKGKKNKALYIGLGVIALGGLIYFLMRKKGTTSTNVMINIANYSTSDYEPLTYAQIKAKVDEVNGLINQLGVDETIKQLQSQIDSYMSDGSPESLAYASLLEDIITDLENQSRSTSSSIAPSDMTMGMGTSPDMTMGMGTSMGTSPDMTMGMGTTLDMNTLTPQVDLIYTQNGVTPTPSTNDMNTFVDPISTPIVSPLPPNTQTTTIATPTTPLVKPIPQLNNGLFDILDYPGVTQALIDSKIDEINASVQSNGVIPTITSLLNNANQLDSSQNAIDRTIGKLIYDMAATLDIINNPANASKYTITGTQQSWREWLIARYKLNTDMPDIPGLVYWLYVSWARYTIDFPQPYQTTYDNLPYASSKRSSLNTLVSQNGAINVVNNLIFNLTPLGKLFKATVSRS